MLDTCGCGAMAPVCIDCVYSYCEAKCSNCPDEMDNGLCCKCMYQDAKGKGYALVAELVDVLDLGSSTLDGVWVRVPSGVFFAGMGE